MTDDELAVILAAMRCVDCVPPVRGGDGGLTDEERDAYDKLIAVTRKLKGYGVSPRE